MPNNHLQPIYVRNEFNFWASLTLQETRSIHVRASLTLQETQSNHDSMNIPKKNSLHIFTFYYKYLKYKTYL